MHGWMDGLIRNQTGFYTIRLHICRNCCFLNQSPAITIAVPLACLFCLQQRNVENGSNIFCMPDFYILLFLFRVGWSYYHRERQPLMPTLTPMGNLKSLINPLSMFLDWMRELEYSEGTHAYTLRTCKFCTERFTIPEQGFKLVTLMLWGNHGCSLGPIVQGFLLDIYCLDTLRVIACSLSEINNNQMTGLSVQNLSLDC